MLDGADTSANAQQMLSMAAGQGPGRLGEALPGRPAVHARATVHDGAQPTGLTACLRGIELQRLPVVHLGRGRLPLQKQHRPPPMMGQDAQGRGRAGVCQGSTQTGRQVNTTSMNTDVT